MHQQGTTKSCSKCGEIKPVNQFHRAARKRAYYEVHREDIRAAIKRGQLLRPDICESCGRGGEIQAAHHDYEQPLAVHWLCRSCHTRWDMAEPKSRLPKRE